MWNGGFCCENYWRSYLGEERLICLWKQAGFSSQEIARHQVRAVGSVDTMFSRAKKLRLALVAVGVDVEGERLDDCPESGWCDG
jgi:hypothetical protein